ncbi:hypothetical protein BG011_005747 [Mortierella polycephala]|uniref:LysM domain-containing protein n=1 Tax=Mortierella polycephala TaxID=41804 RepID=A0A9P6PY12_9FUNG|nr:hypothetical protein BG011_005747 [Mortierella polycephala]
MKRASQHAASASAAPMQGPIQAVMNDPLQASTSASLSNNDGLEYHVHHEQTPSCINASINNSTGKHSTSNNDFSAHTTMEHFIVVPSADPLQQIEKHQPQKKQRQQHMHHPLSHAADPGHTTKDDRGDDDAREADDDPRFKIRLGGGTVSRGRRHEDNQAADPGQGYDPLANNSKDVDSGDTKDQTGVAPGENTISIHDRFTTPNCAGERAVDPERSPAMTGRSVHRPADLLEPRVPETESGRHRQTGPSKHLTPAPSSPLSSTQSKHKPPEHLTDMGPLEIERKIDSGVQLTQDSVSASTSAFTSNSTVNGTIVEAPSSQCHLRRPSSSTLVSEDSCPLYTTSKASSLSKVSDYHGTESRGMAWSGEHPLLADFATEPEAMSDDDSLRDQSKLASPSHQRVRSSSLRHKGHSMSLDTHQDPGVQQPSESSFASSSGARHRGRNVSKGNDERSWTTYADKVHGHGRSATEAVGKRVIIHQVAITDTLAGISLFYGIQLSVLKTTNRLWTNDSIHTRKYLYIPFEECTVTRQTGVVVDESNQTVTLPERSLQHHTRSGSLFTPGSFQPAAASPMANSRLSSYDVGGPIPDSYNSSHVSTANNLSLTEEYAPVVPTISSIAAGMLPSTSVTVAPPSAATPSPRVGTWTEPKSLVAPPVPSPAMTTTVLKSDNSLGASSVTPQQTTGAATLLSENLPNTVIVPPSMTHEVLAARFKEMDLVSSEQQQRKTLNQEQELRTNPVHHRHKATDLRQYSQHHQQQQTLQSRNSGKSSPSVSNTGSRRASVDVDTHEFLVQGGVDVNGKRESAAGPHDVRQKVNGVYSAIEEEEGCDQYPRQQSESDFVTFGHHRHIYESDERQIDEVPTTLRRQELVTVPTGMLSFFPSPEHSKKLETPQSISRLQTRFDSYGSSSLSSSSSSGSFRRMSQDKRVTGTMPSRGRTALSEHTFQAPASAASDRQRGNQERYSESSASTTDPGLETGVSDFARAFYPRTVRVHQQHYSAQNWSLMGESLVQELLGAVRGPLQIARRMYNFTAFGLGSTMGGSGKDADFEPGGLKRRTSTRGTGSTRLRNRQSKDFRNSGPAIELNLTGATKLHADPTVAISSGEATGSVATTSGMSAAQESTATNGSATGSVDKRTPVVCVVDAVGLDDKSARAARRRSGHSRGSSTGSNHSVRKRSLRSSNPANHAALMALVNELDKDRKGKQKEDEDKADDKVEETISNHTQGPSPPSPVTDILARPL